ARVAPTVNRHEPPDVMALLAETARAVVEGPRRADRLLVPAPVDGVRVREEAVGAARARRAVDGGDEGQVDAAVLPAPAGDEHVAPDVEGPEHVPRPLAAHDLLRPPEREHAEAPPVGSADGRDEEAEVAPLDTRLPQAQVRGEQDGVHVVEAEDVVEVEVEGEEREAGPLRRAVAVPDEREEREAAAPELRRRQRARRVRRPRLGARPVREEEEAEAPIPFFPAARRDRKEDLGPV